MLRSTHELIGHEIKNGDGAIGKVADVLFVDREWVVSYFVADTNEWLNGRKILLPPAVIRRRDWRHCEVPVHSSKEQIEKAPLLDSGAPISRQHEQELHDYWDIPPYWVEPGAVETMASSPVMVMTCPKDREEPDIDACCGHPNLCSCKEIRGYHVYATDGDIGHIDDFITDDEEWVVRYLVVDIGDWLPGRKVILPLARVREVCWSEARVLMDITRGRILRAAPSSILRWPQEGSMRRTS
jgi:uncharacterized protein YrrD